jgi:hypothetical protein
VEATNTSSWARWRAITIWRSDMEEIARIYHRRGGAEVRYRKSHEDHHLGREVCARASGKRYYVLVLCLWLMRFGEFMYE